MINKPTPAQQNALPDVEHQNRYQDSRKVRATGKPGCGSHYARWLPSDWWRDARCVVAIARRYAPYILLAALVGLWVLSVRSVDVRSMTDLGFLSILPPTAYLALGALVVSAAVLIFLRPHDNFVIFAYIAAFVLIVHGTPNVLYGTLRYAWSWKHVGIVDYIQRHGSVDPHISYLSVYHNWPGFFAVNAVLVDLLGVGSALSYAGWSPVFFNLIDAGALLLIFTSLTHDRRVVWSSVLIFCISNWVGQDYFSPQAFAYFLHLVILGITLRWLRNATPRQLPPFQRLPVVRKLASGYNRLITQYSDPDTPVAVSPRGLRWLYQGLIILMFAVIVISHQITPPMTLFMLFGLLLLGQTNTRVLPFVLAAIFVLWLVTGAAPFMRGQVTELVDQLGQITDHLSSNLHNTTQFSAGQVLVSAMVRGLTFSVLALAFLGGLRRLIHHRIDLPAIVGVLAPFTALAANSYGGEIVFRVYFFALPFLSLYIAWLLFPTPSTRLRWHTAVGALAMCGAIFTGFLFAYYGKDAWNYFTPNEVAGADYVFNNAPPDTLIIEGSRNYPSEYRFYERFTYVKITQEIDYNKNQDLLLAPVPTLVNWMANPKYAAAFIIISRAQIIEADSLGEIPRGTLENIRQSLLSSPLFRVVYSNPDITVFRLADKYDTIAP